jgi:hypothetical protein
VQTCGLVKEFHVPAQAVPLLATVRIAGLLDSNENVSVRVALRMFLAVAVKTCVLPTSSDAFGVGVRVTLAGTEFATTFVVLLVPQPARKKQVKRIPVRDVPEANLPMNPSTKEWTSLCWKTISVEVEHFFSKLGAVFPDVPSKVAGK